MREPLICPPPGEPRILVGHSRVHAYFALRSLSSWRFSPAQLVNAASIPA
ncbi:MAG: hypothetical protein GY856_01175 [bacterium]|nr:hypothetical protein [bacterium]